MATDRTIPLSAVSLRVTEAGGGGRPLLVVHGFGGSRTDFEDFLDRLAARGWHAVAPDLRGHGESEQPLAEADYSFEIFADDLLELATALGWDEFALLGHSMGGMIAQVLALRAPARVPALVLMDTSHGPFALDPDLAALGASIAREQGIDALADVVKGLDDPLTTEAYLRKCEEDPSHAERGDRNMRASSPAMYASMLLQIVNAESRLDRLRELPMPVLVVVGEQDEPFLEPSRQIATAVADGRLAILADGGHSPQFEAPGAWWEALTPFLDDVSTLVPIPDQRVDV